MAKKTIAAIDIGSSSIRMTIAEIIDDQLHIIDHLKQSVRLGKDSFDRGRISRSTMNDCIYILKKYKKLCDEYQVTEIRAAATTAVREAANVDIFIDNVRSYTGIQIEIFPSTKVMQYIYNAFIKHLKENDFIRKDEYQSIVEVGAGSVEIIIFNKESIVFARSLPIGALRVKQFFSHYSSVDHNFSRYFNSLVKIELKALKRDLPFITVSKIYGIGSDLEKVSRLLVHDGEYDLVKVDKDQYSSFCESIKDLTESEIVHQFNVSYDMSETFFPVVFMFKKIVEFFDCNEIYITNISLREGLIDDMMRDVDDDIYYNRQENQLTLYSINIGRTMNFDEVHAQVVSKMALRLFDATASIHHLGKKERGYLIVASILHDIGTSVSPRAHHKHSLYVINAQEFFHFDDVEKNIIANIARYHRRSAPKPTHPEYMRLSVPDRMTVIKLAAILRIADSLDNSGQQIVDLVNIEVKDDKLILTIVVRGNIVAEAYAFKTKRELFEDFFGIDVKLRIKRKIEDGSK